MMTTDEVKGGERGKKVMAVVEEDVSRDTKVMTTTTKVAIHDPRNRPSTAVGDAGVTIIITREEEEAVAMKMKAKGKVNDAIIKKGEEEVVMGDREEKSITKAVKEEIPTTSAARCTTPNHTPVLRTRRSFPPLYHTSRIINRLSVNSLSMSLRP